MHYSMTNLTLNYAGQHRQPEAKTRGQVLHYSKEELYNPQVPSKMVKIF